MPRKQPGLSFLLVEAKNGSWKSTVQGVKVLLTEKNNKTYFVAFGYGAVLKPRISKALQKPSRHSARLGAFSGEALRGA